ncbi:SH3 domain-containing protein [Rhizobiaceae bacterium BDR2-2]|uniref:SH3 domain-containing protein n=1 Tax=Ectorhizobium quercum TaxID=2965071 RepID=A0AAE3MWY1_9HYPH|nr:SH3 domain-containing protein [Ectorhizobium quercum]MCX8995624.1 SH3 domain-containing protein [Ectorhizobium quercum]
MRRVIFRSCLAFALGLVTMIPEAQAQNAKGASGLPLPRFVSLKARRVNLRIGPSTDYAAAWMYTRAGLPVEITQEYENWRKIRDADGTEGWVNQSLLSGERMAVAAPWMRSRGEDVYVNLRRDRQPNATITARLEPGVIFRIRECNGDWCRAEAGGIEGWVAQSEIWGAYPGEAFK